MNALRLIRNAIRTPDGTVIESFSRHDCKTYIDANGKEYMIDGGLDYVRSSAHGDEVSLCLFDNEPHRVQADVLKWGSYGKDDMQHLQRISIGEMETDHIEAVLEKCRVLPVMRDCMLRELTLRKLNKKWG